MADEILKRDENHVPVLGAITNDASQEVRMLRVDPSTGRLLADATGSGLVTGSGTSGQVTIWNGTSSITGDTAFLYDSVTDRLTVHAIKPDASDGLLIESNNGTDVALFGAGNGSGATFYGGVNITGNLAVDTNVLYVDTVNNMVGIGTTSPSYNLHVMGTFSSSSYAFISGTTVIGAVPGALAGMYPSTNSNTLVIANGDFTSKISVFGSSASPANNIMFTNNSVESMRIDASGNVGIMQASPTAKLHLGAGTATANTAPLKFTSGTNLTTAEAGAMEYDGTNLFFTRTGTTRESVFIGVSGATAPSTNVGVAITNYYGSSATNFLGDPNAWASVVIGGTTYKIPLYT